MALFPTPFVKIASSSLRIYIMEFPICRAKKGKRGRPKKGGGGALTKDLNSQERGRQQEEEEIVRRTLDFGKTP